MCYFLLLKNQYGYGRVRKVLFWLKYQKLNFPPLPITNFLFWNLHFSFPPLSPLTEETNPSSQQQQNQYCKYPKSLPGLFINPRLLATAIADKWGFYLQTHSCEPSGLKSMSMLSSKHFRDQYPLKSPSGPQEWKHSGWEIEEIMGQITL